MRYPPVTFIEMLEEVYAAVEKAEQSKPDDLPESEYEDFIAAHELGMRHEHDPDGMVAVFQGDTELFRCSEERHQLLWAVIDLEAREYVPGDSS